MKPNTKYPTEKGTAAISLRDNTDPTKGFKGVGGILIGLGKGNKKERELKEITSDKFTSKVIFDTYGKEFFSELKIPEKEIFNFIDYCKQYNIRELHNKGLGLQVAVLLEREAPIYLKRLKQ